MTREGMARLGAAAWIKAGLVVLAIAFFALMPVSSCLATRLRGWYTPIYSDDLLGHLFRHITLLQAH